MEKEIIGMSNEEIYDKYIHTIDNIYKKFKFLAISKSDYYKLVLRVITKSRTKYDGTVLYHVYLVDEIQTILFKKINALLSNDDTAYTVLTNYIKANFERPSIYSHAVLYLKKVSELFTNANFFPDPDLIIKLITENTKFKRAIKAVVENHIEEIENAKLNNMFDETAIMMIQAYCGINNIKSKGDIDVRNISNVYTTDTVRAYLNEVSDIPLLTEQEQEKYGYMLLEGSEEARQKLIEGNLYLVVSVATRYISSGMPFADLIQDGNEGLINAVNKYDVRKGYHFSTYASWWITCKIKRSLVVNVYKQQKFNSVSLNELVGAEEDTELGDLLVDEDTRDDNDFILAGLPNDIRKLLSACRLSEREIKVLTLLYGLDGKEPMSQVDVGRVLGGLTRERIRQIESLALKRIRTSPYVNQFAIYLDDPDKGMDNLYQMRRRYRETCVNKFKRDLENMITVDRTIK